MSDLIDKQEAIEILASAYEFFEDDMDIDNARYAAERVFAYVPSAERRGKWEKHPLWKGAEAVFVVCSACNSPAWWPTDYCPNCGAKMEE